LAHLLIGAPTELPFLSRTRTTGPAEVGENAVQLLSGLRIDNRKG
jgi:hypothetical protein